MLSMHRSGLGETCRQRSTADDCCCALSAFVSARSALRSVGATSASACVAFVCAVSDF